MRHRLTLGFIVVVVCSLAITISGFRRKEAHSRQLGDQIGRYQVVAGEPSIKVDTATP